jgi:hypothetical protein
MKHQPSIASCEAVLSGLFPMKSNGLTISRVIRSSVYIFKQDHSCEHEANENSSFGLPCRHGDQRRPWTKASQPPTRTKQNSANQQRAIHLASGWKMQWTT